MKDEKYWVASNVEEPERIFFNAGDAFDDEYNYLDSFDSNGMHVKAYKLVDDRYTTDF